MFEKQTKQTEQIQLFFCCSHVLFSLPCSVCKPPLYRVLTLCCPLIHTHHTLCRVSESHVLIQSAHMCVQVNWNSLQFVKEPFLQKNESTLVVFPLLWQHTGQSSLGEKEGYACPGAEVRRHQQLLTSHQPSSQKAENDGCWVQDPHPRNVLPLRVDLATWMSLMLKPPARICPDVCPLDVSSTCQIHHHTNHHIVGISSRVPS